MRTWDAYDCADTCSVCGGDMQYGSAFCSDACFLQSLTPEKRVKELRDRAAKAAAKEARLAAQKARMLDRLANHVPVYQPHSETVRFYLTGSPNRDGRDFLGLYKAGTQFIFGSAVYFYRDPIYGRTCTHFENPLQMESFMFHSNYDLKKYGDGEPIHILDDRGVVVPYFDFEHLILGTIYDPPQRGGFDSLDIFDGHMQSYRYAWGL